MSKIETVLALSVGASALLMGLACAGLRGSGEPSVILAEIGSIEGTRLETPAQPIPTLTFDVGGEAVEIDDGDGVQILSVSPTGEDRRALQVAVLFDRPMVAVTDLDTMAQSIPLRCSPKEIPVRARWAGTQTAVLSPVSGSFPRATRVQCEVQAGATAIDGVALEKTVSWSFETPRPHVVEITPEPNSDEVDPKTPIVLVFDQPIEPSQVEGHVSLVGPDGAVSLRASRPTGGDGEDLSQRVALTGKLSAASSYTLRVEPGIVGTEGPLPSTAPREVTFTTFGPLTVLSTSPHGKSTPRTWFEINFSTRVSQDEVAKHLTISPAVEDWDPPDGDWDWRLYHYGHTLQPNTAYTVTITQGLEDVWGQTLSAPYSFTFETGDHEPWLTAPRDFRLYAANNPKDLPFKHLNASRIDAVTAPFDPLALTDASSEWSKAVDARFADASGRRIHTVEVSDEPNRTELDSIELASVLSGNGLGWFATRLSTPDVTRWDGKVDVQQGLFVVTDLGGTLKVGPGSTEIWVTSLSKGQPVAGVDVTLFWGANKLGSVVTNGDGLARLEGTPWSPWDRRLWARLSLGDDTSVVLQRWNDGLEPWSFGLYGGIPETQVIVAGHSFADRGIYRPGDDVHARATFRLKTAQGLSVPRAEVRWTLSDPFGAESARGDGQLDDRGGFSVETKIPAAGALGSWSLDVTATAGPDAGATATILLPALAYRAPAFRVEVHSPSDAVAGQEVSANADARYLFGAKLKAGEARWHAWTEPGTFSPEDYDDYSFQLLPRWWEEQDSVAPSRSDGVRPLVDGASSFTHRVLRDDRGQTLNLVMEAEIEDVDRQVIANRSTTRVHPAAFYVGLRTDAGLPSVGDSIAVDVVSLDAQSAPTVMRKEPVEVKLVRREWSSVRERSMNGQWRWVNTPADEIVQTQQVTTTDSSTPAHVSLSPKKAGYHLIVANAKDGSGNKVVAELGVYVLGSGYIGWGRTDDNHIELVADKKTYRPGDTARILVKAPAEGMAALVTTEREGVLSRRVVTLASTAETLDIPITSEMRPNAYVSVVAVRGAGPQDAPDKGRPEVYMGITELSVDSAEEHLSVSITPRAKQFSPRDEVTAEIKVERAGKPVPGAGVTLYAVDEAVLSLTDYQTPDPFDAFYERRGLSVLTADARVAAVDRAAYLTKGAGRGGGGGMEAGGPELRSRFLTTITWQPDLRTGSDGVVSATWTLPDNLTTFRIIAVADAGGASFGSGETEIEVRKKLMVRPALPRLLRAGDQAYAGVVVHNDTDRARWVKVSGEVRGAPVELTGSPVEVKVEARASVEVPFKIHALEQGNATFTFRATANQDVDALEWPLIIERDVLLDTVATTGVLDAARSSVTERIAKPDGAHATFGGLEVSVGTTALAGIGTGFAYLHDYPHTCAEQRTSRGLGALAMLRVLDRISAPALSRDELEAEVKSALSDLHAYQVSGEGLGYWKGAYWPNALPSAYGLELMARAEAAGFVVDKDLEEDLVTYLRDVVTAKRPSDWKDDAANAIVGDSILASALARAGSGDAGLNSRLFGRRKDLSVYGQASLLEAIVRTTGADARTKELSAAIAGRSFVEAASASVKENESGRYARLWGSDDLSTAQALSALVLSGDHPLAPRYALHLASSRTADRWANTRATAGVLLALADYADKYEVSGGNEVQASVTLAGRELLAKGLAMPATASVQLGLPDVSNGDLVMTASGGRLYYSTRLAYAPKSPPPRDEGFTITRSLQWLEGSGESGVLQAGALVRVNLTVVNPVVRHDVAVIDRLPAGFEPVDTSLATASRAPRGDEMENLGYEESIEERADELPEFGGVSFDHHEIDDAEVRLYASYLPPGVHTFRYVVRATTPGQYSHPPATVEEMYEPENFGRTSSGTLTIGGNKELAAPGAPQ